MADVNLWSALGGALGAVAGVAAKTFWDEYAGWRAGIPIETWKIRVGQLERLLSEFYWPLYVRLMRDDVVWEKVFYELRPRHDRPMPEWAKGMNDEARGKLSEEIENKVIIPNHNEAVSIIRSSMHLARVDAELLDYIKRYIRHVDTYASLRSCGLQNVEPIDVGEPYPEGFSRAVYERLTKYQTEYENLVREKGIADIKSVAK